MKRFFYMIAAAALVFAACEREIEPAAPSSAGNFFPEGKVAVNFTATYPDLLVETKAMAQAPVINELYVALFGSEGSFQAWIPCVNEGFQSDYVDHATKANYVVYLPITDRPRRLHFVANPPKDEEGNVIYPAFGDEEEVINAMVKKKGDTANEAEDAYWQKINLDQIDALENSQPDAYGYYQPSTALSSALSDVCLVRNYAKVQVSVKKAAAGEKQEPYELLEYALINVPGSGSVAPWNTGSAQYEPLYMNILSYAGQPRGTFYERLSGSYFGYMPNANDIITTCPKSFVSVDENGNSVGDFMYERTMFTRQSALNSQTGFLAHIKWTEKTEISDGITIPAETEMWYKIQITGSDGEYIPFLRNILYSITLEGIKETGYDTADEAAANDFAGDVSIGLALSSLNELSNGVSTIRVNHTEFTSNGQKEIDTDGDGKGDKVPDYVIEWQYFPNSADATGTAITEPGTGTLDGKEYDVTISMYDLTTESAIDCNLTYLLENQLGKTTHDGQTWGTITVPISELGEVTKTSVVRISGQYGTSRRIFREVMINVVSKQDFVNVQPQSTDPSLAKTTYIEADEYDGLNKRVVVHFSLPDDLGASLFPLNIKIEAADNNLTSTSPDLPVNSGVSAFNDSNNSFYFIRQVTLDEYRYIEDGEYKYNNDFTATLFTNKMSGNSTSIILSDEKGYMNPEKTLTLTVNPPHTVTFNTNNDNFPDGQNSKTTDGVTLTFSGINSRQNGHLRLLDYTTFAISSTSATITNVIIHYTGNQYGSSGRNGNYSSSNPATTSGYVYATNGGDTGNWTGSSSSITFTMRRSQNQDTIRISSIEVSYYPN